MAGVFVNRPFDRLHRNFARPWARVGPGIRHGELIEERVLARACESFDDLHLLVGAPSAGAAAVAGGGIGARRGTAFRRPAAAEKRPLAVEIYGLDHQRVAFPM